MLVNFVRAFAIAATALLSMAANAAPITVDFRNQGTFTSSSFSQNGVTITGSANLGFFAGDGLGVVGGANDDFMDVGEWLMFSFDEGAAQDISISRNLGGYAGPPFMVFEGFGIDGTSLGTVTINGTPRTWDISEAFGGELLSGFRVSSPNSWYQWRDISFTSVPVESVPEPGTLALFGAGLAGLSMLRKRRRHS
jgi:hypothetical protein